MSADPQSVAELIQIADLVAQQSSPPMNATHFLDDRVLPVCSPEEAAVLFERHADHATCVAALTNSDGSVRNLAIRHLRAFADRGDPFARQVLHEHGLGYLSPPEEPPFSQSFLQAFFSDQPPISPLPIEIKKGSPE